MTYQFSYKDVIMIIDLRLKSVLYLINFCELCSGVCNQGRIGLV